MNESFQCELVLDGKPAGSAEISLGPAENGARRGTFTLPAIASRDARNWQLRTPTGWLIDIDVENPQASPIRFTTPTRAWNFPD